MQDAEKIARERRFHDERFGSDDDRSSNRFYAITGESGRHYRDTVGLLTAPADVLEIGCGDNAEGWDLAARGLTVTSIDISPVAVTAAQERARAERVTNATFLEMDAERLEFPDDSFDAVIGSGILHHLDMERAVPEVARVLRPGGRSTFLEPLGLNPALRLYRAMTPSERTPDEHPLLRSDLRSLERWFERVDLRFFHLASLGAIPLMSSKYFDRALRVLNRYDEAILSRSGLAQDLSWFVVIDLAGPKVVKTT